MRFIAGCVLAFVLTCGVAQCDRSRPLTRPSKQQVIADLQKGAKADFEQRLKNARELARQRGRSNMSEKDRQGAISAFKNLFYNSLYIRYHCMMTEWTEDVEKFATQVKQCFDERAAAHQKFFQLSENIRAFDNQTLLRCELVSRLFEAEIEFPRFDFLQDDNVFLFDAAKLNECLFKPVR
jgi:hypothetical protein